MHIGAEGIWVFVEEAVAGGFRVRVVCDGSDVYTGDSMIFEEAHAMSIGLQRALGLSAERVLVNITDVMKTPDRSRAIEAIRQWVREAEKNESIRRGF